MIGTALVFTQATTHRLEVIYLPYAINCPVAKMKDKANRHSGACSYSPFLLLVGMF